MYICMYVMYNRKDKVAIYDTTREGDMALSTSQVGETQWEAKQIKQTQLHVEEGESTRARELSWEALKLCPIHGDPRT